MSLLYRFVLERNESAGVWLCIIVNRVTRRAVTVGIFDFKAQAIRWAKDAIQRRAWRDGSELPDSYDARGVKL